jgi:hypothetical protein
MNRRKWLWTALAALPLAVAAGLVYAQSQARSYTCPITGEELPCPNCCPLNQKGQADNQQPAAEQGYICPITGEELPCPNCCPLNQKTQGKK